MSWRVFASIPMACLLAAGLLGITPAANAETAGPSVQRSSKIASHNGLKIRRPFRSVRIYLPLGATSGYYDYLYYYSRGHYPTHVGGYAYYTNKHIYYPRYVGPRPLRSYRPHSY